MKPSYPTPTYHAHNEIEREDMERKETPQQTDGETKLGHTGARPSLSLSFCLVCVCVCVRVCVVCVNEQTEQLNTTGLEPMTTKAEYNNVIIRPLHQSRRVESEAGRDSPQIQRVWFYVW
jgi:hypothetical protein